MNLRLREHLPTRRVGQAVLNHAWTTCLLFAMTTSSASANERVLSLDDALELARVHNRDLRAARARLEQSATNLEQAWVALRPQVSAQGKYTHNYKEVTLDFAQFNQGTLGLADTIKGTSGNEAENAAIGRFEQALNSATTQKPITIQPSEQLDSSATVTVPLVVPSAYAGLSAARLAHRSNGAGFEVTEATVLLSVAQAYYAAAGSDELVLARKHAVAVARETRDIANARREAGFVNQVEVMRAEVSLVRAEQDEAESENSRDVAYRGLATLLGERQPFRVELASTVPPVPAASPMLVENARRLRPEVAQYRLALAGTQASVRAAAWRWAPSLSAFGSVRAFNYKGFSGDPYSWAVGLELDWLLYDGGARDAQRRLAAAQSEENQARLDLLQDSLGDEVLNARGTLDTRRRALDAAARSLELAGATLRLVRSQYDAGTVKQLDVLQAQDSLVVAEVAVVQAHFDLALADLQLRRAIGTFPSRPMSDGDTAERNRQ